MSDLQNCTCSLSRRSDDQNDRQQLSFQNGYSEATCSKLVNEILLKGVGTLKKTKIEFSYETRDVSHSVVTMMCEPRCISA